MAESDEYEPSSEEEVEEEDSDEGDVEDEQDDPEECDQPSSFHIQWGLLDLNPVLLPTPTDLVEFVLTAPANLFLQTLGTNPDTSPRIAFHLRDAGTTVNERVYRRCVWVLKTMLQLLQNFTVRTNLIIPEELCLMIDELVRVWIEIDPSTGQPVVDARRSYHLQNIIHTYSYILTQFILRSVRA